MEFEYALQKTTGLIGFSKIIKSKRDALIHLNYLFIDYAAEFPKMSSNVHELKNSVGGVFGCLDELIVEVLLLPEVAHAFNIVKSSDNPLAKTVVKQIYDNIPNLDVYLPNNPSTF